LERGIGEGGRGTFGEEVAERHAEMRVRIENVEEESGITIVHIVTTIGIGATTAVFSVVYGVL